MKNTYTKYVVQAKPKLSGDRGWYDWYSSSKEHKDTLEEGLKVLKHFADYGGAGNFRLVKREYIVKDSVVTG